MEYKVSKNIFSKESLLKVVYLLQENFIFRVTEEKYNWVLTVEPNKSDMVFDFEKFNRELSEQQLREMLNNQFGTLRDSIYQKAFLHFSGM